MLILDSNNILSTTQEEQTGKLYTRRFAGRVLQAYDHAVLLYTKSDLQIGQWKDIGAGQNILLKRTPLVFADKPHPGYSRLGYDVLYKYDETKGEIIRIARPDELVANYVPTVFGSGTQVLAVPTYEKCLETESIVSFLFGISLAHGKWTVKNDTLYPIKITLPLTSSLMGRRDLIDGLSASMLAQGILHTIQYTQAASYEIVQLVIHDPLVLKQYATWLTHIVNIKQISTYDYTQRVYQALVVYAQENGYELPFASADELTVIACD
ncbi:MAG: hypothetical protein WCJ81_08955 [bacterium]